ASSNHAILMPCQNDSSSPAYGFFKIGHRLLPRSVRRFLFVEFQSGCVLVLLFFRFQERNGFSLGADCFLELTGLGVGGSERVQIWRDVAARCSNRFLREDYGIGTVANCRVVTGRQAPGQTILSPYIVLLSSFA